MFSLFSVYVEYCGNDDFAPSCAQDEVIVMTYALYGRMQLGRCVQHDMGYLGCQTDVIRVLDEKCSNKRSCDFKVLLELGFDLTISNPCKELSRYLDAEYYCQKSEYRIKYTMIEYTAATGSRT